LLPLSVDKPSLCHSEERPRSFAALIYKQATKNLGFT
jgi:hypothetical protein